MALTDVALAARALIKIGAHPITAFTDGSVEAEVASYLYATTRDGLLSAHPWRFARTQAVLTRLADAPTADFEYAYQLPKDVLRVLSVGTSGRGSGVVYQLRDGALQTDASSVVITYVRSVPEADFPPFFNQALIAKLAAEFCVPLTESSTRAELLTGQAEDAFRHAKLVDSQQASPALIEDFSLLEVRG